MLAKIFIRINGHYLWHRCYLQCKFDGSESLIWYYANLLSLNLDLVRAEMNLLRAMLPDGPLSTAMKTQVEEELLKRLYPNFSKLYRVALCIPVGTATCERSFSAMRRIRNYLRVTMGQERFLNFGLLNIENDIITKVDCENILNQFVSVASRSSQCLVSVFFTVIISKEFFWTFLQ